MKPTLEELLTLRKKGWSVHSIAKIYHMPPRVVSSVLSKAGVPERFIVTTPRSETDPEKVCRLRREGFSLKQIVEQTGIERGTVSRWLSNAGVLKNKSKNQNHQKSESTGISSDE